MQPTVNTFNHGRAMNLSAFSGSVLHPQWQSRTPRFPAEERPQEMAPPIVAVPDHPTGEPLPEAVLALGATVRTITQLPGPLGRS